MEERLIGPHEVAGKLRHDYLSSIDYPDCRLLDALERVLSKLHGKSFRVRDFLQDTAQLIYMQLNINSLSIGLKDLDGDKFRYHAFAGLRPAAEEALRRCIYSKEQFFDSDTYPGSIISKYTKLFLAENNPYASNEEETYNRPVMLTQKRKMPDDSIEGDYLDIHIYDDKNEVIGWIEISGTKSGKLPDPVTIRWLEVISSVIGVAIAIEKNKRLPRRV